MSIEIVPPLAELPTAPAKLRILQTADVLFYDEGIRAVGVDRLIAASAVTKATFYKHYGSKDRVVVAYLGYRHRRMAEWLAGRADELREPRAILEAVRDDAVARITAPGFRGCAFLNAAAEYADPDHEVRVAIRDHRDWYADALERLMRALGHPLPGDAADELLLALDGAAGGGYAGDPIAATAALARVVARIAAEADARS